jgi:hypothetical protein
LNSSTNDLTCKTLRRPREAVKVLKRRLLNRNPKVQLLTLELTDLAIDNCSLPLHTQIAGKDFINAVSQLARNRETVAPLKEKVLGLVQKWALKFEQSQDILPGFNELYQSLKAAGLQFGAEPVDRKHFVESYDRRASEPITIDRQSVSEAKLDKLKQDLGVVQENIALTNDMIDAADPRDNVARNEVLTQLVATLKAMEGKLVRLIAGVSDEELQRTCRSMRERIEYTLARFEDLKHGRKPAVDRFAQGRSTPEKAKGASDEAIDLIGQEISAKPAPPQKDFDPFAGLSMDAPISFPVQAVFPYVDVTASLPVINPTFQPPAPQPVIPTTYQTPLAFQAFPPSMPYMFPSTVAPQPVHPPQFQVAPPSHPAPPPEVKIRHNMGLSQEEAKSEPEKKPTAEFDDLFNLDQI